MSAPARIAALGLLACACATGCVDRRIFITSDPSGARVYLNDQDVGVTPLEVNFTWFGTYDVRLRKEGYEPLVTTREAKAPLHEVPPFDFVALAVPGTKTTHIEWNFELKPAPNDPAALLARADQLRAEVEKQEAPRDETSPAQPTPPDATPIEPATPTPAPAAKTPTKRAPSAGPDYIEVTPTDTSK